MILISLKEKMDECQESTLGGNSFPGFSGNTLHDWYIYATEKEVYLGNICQVVKNENTTNLWQFWMIMFRNWNYDTTFGLYPEKK